jgi:hypothetical protein
MDHPPHPVLDVNEEEARTLLLSIDPLAALAEIQRQLHERLLTRTPTTCAVVLRSAGPGQAAFPGAIPAEARPRDVADEVEEPRGLRRGTGEGEGGGHG